MLNQTERRIVQEEILHWNGTKWLIHALTVMPDHVHILATPLEATRNQWYALSEILQSIKRRSAMKINHHRGVHGRVWQAESFDRIIRNQKEFDNKFNYILSNATERELVPNPYDYDGFWCEGLQSIAEMKALQHPPAHYEQPTDFKQPRIPHEMLIVKKRRKLPHWQLGGSTYFITFRLHTTSSVSVG